MYKFLLTILILHYTIKIRAQNPLTTSTGVKTMDTYHGDLNTNQNWGGTGATGMYMFNANNGTNNPSEWTHIIEMQHDNGNAWAGQIGLGYFTDKMYYRQQDTYNWRTWHTIATEDFVQNKIDGLTNNGTFQSAIFNLNDNTGTNIRIGDDAFLGDINEANTIGLKGAQDNTQGWLHFGREGNGGTKIGSTSSGNFLIDNLGNVGIGITNPSGKLEVNGDIYSHSLRFGSSLEDKINGGPWYGIGGSSLSLGQGAPSNAYAIQVAGYWGLNFQTALGQMVMTNAGNIGIGTISPTAKLAVNGNIKAQEIIVTNNSTDWPDYVFTPKYILPNLDILEQKIKKQGHLPGIPSSQEINKEGINLGELNRKLLEKIEELTLYIIQQDKRIQTLEKNNRN